MQRPDDFHQPFVDVVLFYDPPEAIMPDTMECFVEVDKIMKEVLRMFKVLFHQQPSVEYLFRGTPLWSETGLFVFQDLFCLVY